MRTLATTVVLLGLLVEQAWAQQETEQPTPPSNRPCTGVLEGDVVDKTTHEPIAGAVVTVDGTETALTDENGHFVLRQICPGQHAVEASRVDYPPGTKTFTLRKRASIEIELSSGAVSEDVIVIEDTSARDTEMRSSTDISGEALERTRGRSFSETLSEVPGVSQLGSATGVAKPIVRGQFGRRLLLLVDSVRHRAQEWGLDHAPEIDPFGAETLTVVRGASGVRFGSDAIGGAILVKPPALRRDPGYNGEAHLIGISNGRGGSVAARVQALPASVPRMAYQLEGSFKRLSAPRTPSYALDNAGVMEWNVAATGGYRLDDTDFKLSYRHYQARLGVCVCLSIDSSDDFFAQLEREEPLGADLFDDDFEIERPFQAVVHDQLMARARWRSQAIGTVTATYALQWDHRREFDIVRSATGPQFDFRLWTHDIDVTLRHKPLHLSDHLHLRGVAGVSGVAQFHDFSGLPLVPDHMAGGGGAHVSERLLSHDFELEAGIRFDHLRRTASIVRRDFLRLVRSGQIAADACGGGDPDPVDCDSSFSTLSASLGGLWQASEPLSLKLDLSTASRAPNPDEQYLNGTSPTLPVLGLGKPDLGPETTFSASTTLSYSSDILAAEVSAYTNYISDYIYFAPALDDDGMPIFDVLVRGSFPRFVTRPVNALFYGGDGGVTARPLPWLELGGQVSLVRARNRTDDSPLVFVPPDRARGTVAARGAELLGFRAGFAQLGGTFVARQKRFDVNADLASPPDSYFLLDAELGAETSLGDQTVKVALRGSNLLNARYRDYTSLLRYFADQPGWQATLRLSIHFDSQ